MNTISHPDRMAARAPPAEPDTVEAAARAGVRFDGRSYCFREFRYDHLDDALAYARHVRTHPAAGDSDDPGPLLDRSNQPTPGQDASMAALNITYDGRQYRFGPYRYDHFLDAAHYALRQMPSLAQAVPVPAERMTAQERHVEDVLDGALAATFPASDPVSITPVKREAPRKPGPSEA
ncbi:hypothetical protein [Massilia sp. TS11]|uniref:hypothetical protein n=1 Tax=Massilia sp. TS11 TaxID=2908003 RepID=UPI001EDAC910|nr:hypothetical protein [Massilia sp. TS11]MCG2586111.1 hypothetical protein [Massilia sp. TS11]